ILLLARLRQEFLLIVKNAREVREVGIDKASRLVARDMQSLGKANSAHPIQDTEVDRFRQPPHLGGNVLLGDAMNLHRNGGVNVLVVSEGLAHRLIAGKMSEQAQLNLRVIGGQKSPTLLRQKRLANLLPHFSTDRNVLQIGIG